MKMLSAFAGLILLAQTAILSAEDRKFPYEAIVDADEGENVWSGPDRSKHYPTAKLKRGDRVLVTAEPKGGSLTPTSAPMIVARPA